MEGALTEQEMKKTIWKMLKEEKEQGVEQKEEGRVEDGGGGQERSGEDRLAKPKYPSQDLGIASKLEEIK